MDEMESYDFDIDQVNEEDDEEISEDEAFNEEDEKKYGAFFESCDEIPRQRRRSSNLLNEDLPEGEDSEGDEEDEDEDEEDEEDEEDDEELSDTAVQDNGSEEEDANEDTAVSEAQRFKSGDDVMQKLLNLDCDDEMSGVDSELEGLDEDGSEEVDDVVDLEYLVSGVDAKNVKRRRGLPEVTEAYDESEFNLKGSHAMIDGQTNGGQKLDFGSLFSSLPTKGAYTELRSKIESLGMVPAPGAAKRKGVSTGPEAAPLPTRMADRLNREAAYEEAQKQVTKWAPLIKKNREADQLIFEGTEPALAHPTSGALVGKFKAITTLEEEVQSILQKAELAEKQQMQLEDMELNKLSKEDLTARRAELAKMRSLMFYQEQKQKKIAKIKSKTYRKLKRKTEGKEAAKLELLAELDPEYAKEAVLKLQAQRIKERMSLKHKNTGKWAKQMLSRNDRGAELRQDLMDQLNRSRDLTKKIAGIESGDEVSSGDDDKYDEGDDGDDEDGRGRALKVLGDLEGDLDTEESAEAHPQKGLMAMKFMQRGLEQQRRETKRKLEEARNQIETGDISEGDEGAMLLLDESDEEASRPKKKKAVQKVTATGTGRFAFGAVENDSEDDAEPKADEGKKWRPTGETGVRVSNPLTVGFKRQRQPLPQIFESVDFEAEEDVFEIKPGKLRGVEPKPAKALLEKGCEESPADLRDQGGEAQERSNAPRAAKGKAESKRASNAIKEPLLCGENPWLAGDSIPVKKSVKMDKNKGSAQDGLANKLTTAKRKRMRDDERQLDGGVELNLDAVKSLESKVNGYHAMQAGRNGKRQKEDVLSAAKNAPAREQKDKNANSELIKAVASRQDYSDEDSDPEAMVKNIVHKSDISSITQRQLMEIAFANDDVLAEFEDEKEKIVEGDAGKDVDVTLPGWGGWGGLDIKPKKNIVVRKAKPYEGIATFKRKDANLKHVIINEKRNKKNSKLLASEVPFGFGNREQYEQTIRLPLGKEWNSAHTHSKFIAPRVITKMGQTIAPPRLGTK
ncbi:hypothetical protein HK101_010836 [Irineochytrium annulatum]|nr:hypothetical protein HK101_010836 [Irineochytrium annulatum]